jgi:hypothetical protein
VLPGRVSLARLLIRVGQRGASIHIYIIKRKERNVLHSDLVLVLKVVQLCLFSC